MHLSKLYMLLIILLEMDFSYDQTDFDFTEAEDASHEGMSLFI